MTKRTTAELKTDITTLLADGGQSGLGIPAADHRQVEDNLSDSLANHLDLANAAGFDGQGVVVDTVNGLAVPGQPAFLRLVSPVVEATTAEENTMVQVDASLASVTISAPANPKLNERFGVKRWDSNQSTFIVINGNGNPIELLRSGFGTTTGSLTVRGVGAEAWWQWNGSIWLAMGSTKTSEYLEIWQATPIVDVSQVGEPIEWTLVPLFTGQVPALLTHAAGTLTNPSGVTLSLSISAEVDLVLNGNNADTGVVIEPVHTAGTGLFLWPRIAMAFGHSRASLFPFSGNSFGIWKPDAADEQMQIVATATNAGNAQTNLLDAIIAVSI